MNPDYNKISHHYDRLAKLVFGNKQELAKKANIELTRHAQKILIVGGGTGRILEYIADVNNKTTVDFVELSNRMVGYANKRKIQGLNVSFFPMDIEEFNGSGYDIIITNFFFDQLTEERSFRILKQLKGKLSHNGLVLFSDFLNPADAKNKAIHAIMKMYFRLTINLRVNRYPDYEKVFQLADFNRISSGLIGDNIIAQVYKN